MKMSYNTRRILSLLILLFGLPIYAVCVVNGMAFLGNLPTFFELTLYVLFGIIWVFPVKFIFKGVGQKNSED